MAKEQRTQTSYLWANIFLQICEEKTMAANSNPSRGKTKSPHVSPLQINVHSGSMS